jgi:hypothetical protein
LPFTLACDWCRDWCRLHTHRRTHTREAGLALIKNGGSLSLLRSKFDFDFQFLNPNLNFDFDFENRKADPISETGFFKILRAAC